MLRKANITKSCGISAYKVFQFLLLLAFQGKNLFRFLLLLSAKVTSASNALTGSEQVKVLTLYTRYNILEWIRRNENDQKTYSESFFIFCEDIQDMNLTDALQNLMALFVEHISTLSADITACVKSKMTEWTNSQAEFLTQ